MSELQQGQLLVRRKQHRRGLRTVENSSKMIYPDYFHHRHNENDNKITTRTISTLPSLSILPSPSSSSMIQFDSAATRTTIDTMSTSSTVDTNNSTRTTNDDRTRTLMTTSTVVTTSRREKKRGLPLRRHNGIYGNDKYTTIR